KAGFRTDRESHAEAWAVGQLIAAEAALRLLAGRAAAAGKPSTEPSQHAAAPWPELAEYGCYACHHALDAKRPDATPIEAKANRHLRRRKAMPWTWGTWYFPDAELRPLLDSDLLQNSPEAKSTSETIENLRTEMAKPEPDCTAVHAMAADAAAQLDRLAQHIDQTAFDARTIKGLLARAAAKDFLPADWDEAARRFLTIEALWKAYRFDNAQQTNGEQATEVTVALEQIRTKLEFPRPARESVVGPNGKSVAARIDSPTGFDAKVIADQFASVSAKIQKLIAANEHP
ncbi:MAG TPA: hypothetical protein VKB78_15415, partial [Pirellulales bacterium]|nr:hypothetical protein [Pirellulales bacterium]